MIIAKLEYLCVWWYGPSGHIPASVLCTTLLGYTTSSFQHEKFKVPRPSSLPPPSASRVRVRGVWWGARDVGDISRPGRVASWARLCQPIKSTKQTEVTF